MSASNLSCYTPLYLLNKIWIEIELAGIQKEKKFYSLTLLVLRAAGFWINFFRFILCEITQEKLTFMSAEEPLLLGLKFCILQIAAKSNFLCKLRYLQPLKQQELWLENVFPRKTWSRQWKLLAIYCKLCSV